MSWWTKRSTAAAPDWSYILTGRRSSAAGQTEQRRTGPNWDYILAPLSSPDPMDEEQTPEPDPSEGMSFAVNPLRLARSAAAGTISMLEAPLAGLQGFYELGGEERMTLEDAAAARELAKLRHQVGGVAQSVAPEPRADSFLQDVQSRPLGAVLEAGAQGLPSIAAAVGANIVLPGAAVPLLASISGSQAYGEARDRDVSVGSSFAGAVVQGTAEGLLENIFPAKIARRLVGEGAQAVSRKALMLLKDAGLEAGTEFSQELVGLAREAAQGKQITQEEIASRLLQSTAGGLVLGGSGSFVSTMGHASPRVDTEESQSLSQEAIDSPDWMSYRDQRQPAAEETDLAGTFQPSMLPPTSGPRATPPAGTGNRLGANYSKAKEWLLNAGWTSESADVALGFSVLKAQHENLDPEVAIARDWLSIELVPEDELPQSATPGVAMPQGPQLRADMKPSIDAIFLSTVPQAVQQDAARSMGQARARYSSGDGWLPPRGWQIRDGKVTPRHEEFGFEDPGVLAALSDAVAQEVASITQEAKSGDTLAAETIHERAKAPEDQALWVSRALQRLAGLPRTAITDPAQSGIRQVFQQVQRSALAQSVSGSEAMAILARNEQALWQREGYLRNDPAGDLDKLAAGDATVLGRADRGHASLSKLRQAFASNPGAILAQVDPSPTIRNGQPAPGDFEVSLERSFNFDRLNQWLSGISSSSGQSVRVSRVLSEAEASRAKAPHVGLEVYFDQAVSQEVAAQRIAEIQQAIGGHGASAILPPVGTGSGPIGIRLDPVTSPDAASALQLWSEAAEAIPWASRLQPAFLDVLEVSPDAIANPRGTPQDFAAWLERARGGEASARPDQGAGGQGEGRGGTQLARAPAGGLAAPAVTTLRQSSREPGGKPRSASQLVGVEGLMRLYLAEGQHDPSSFYNSALKLWRAQLTKAELTMAEKIVGVKDGNWTVQDEERFAQLGERYLRAPAKEQGADPRLHQILDGVRAQLVETYKGLRGGPLEHTLTPESVNFFQKLFRPSDEVQGAGAVVLSEAVELIEKLTGKSPAVMAKKLMGKGIAGLYRPNSRRIEFDPSLANRPKELAAVLLHELGHWDAREAIALAEAEGVQAKTLEAVLRVRDSAKPPTGENYGELKRVAWRWRPMPRGATGKYLSYRASGDEVWADFFSAYVNNPGFARQLAPAATAMLEARMDQSPDGNVVREAMARTDEQSSEAAEGRVERMMQKGAQSSLRAATESQEQSLPLADRVEQGRETLRVWFNRNAAFIRYARKASKNAKAAVMDAVEEIRRLAYTRSKKAAYGVDLLQKVWQPLQDAGVRIEDWDAWLLYRRIEGDRALLANPAGISGVGEDEALAGAYKAMGLSRRPKVAEATALRERLEQRLGADKMAAVEQAQEKFWSLRKRVLLEAGAAKLGSQKWEDFALANEGYVRLTRDLIKAGAPGHLGIAAFARQAGTVGEVRSPFMETLGIDMALLHMSQRTLSIEAGMFIGREAGDQEYQEWQPGTPAPPGKVVVDFVQEGKRKAVLMRPNEAAAFDLEGAEALNRMYRGWKKISRPFEALLTSHNIGWQLWNAQRDLRALAKNFDASLWAATRYFGQEMADLLERAWRQKTFTPASRESEQALRWQGAMLPPGQRVWVENTTADAETPFVELVARVTGEDAERALVRRPVAKLAKSVLDGIAFGGAMSERAIKTAGYRMLKDRGMSDREAASAVRGRAGTPDVLERGSIFQLYNGIFMFSNVGLRGYTGAYESFLSHPAHYLAKTFTYDIAPKALMLAVAGGALKGILDDEQEEALRRWIKKIPLHDLFTYGILPLGTWGGKPVYIRLPKDHFGQAVTQWFSALVDDEKISATDLLEMSAQFLPFDMHPLLESAIVWPGAAAAGVNPPDTFRRRPVIPEREWNEGGTTRLKALFRAMAANVSGPFFYAFGQDQPVTSQLESLLRSAPGSLSGLSRLLKVSDQGISDREQRYRQEFMEEPRQAQLNDIRAAVDDFLQRGIDEPVAIARGLRDKGLDYGTFSHLEARIRSQQRRYIPDTLERSKAYNKKSADWLKQEYGR